MSDSFSTERKLSGPSQPLLIAAHARPPLSAEVFVLHRANKAFVEGASRQPRTYPGSVTCAMVVLASFALVIISPLLVYWIVAPSIESTVLFIIPATLVAWAVFGLSRHFKQRRRVKREARLIKGQIDACSHETGKDTEGDDYVAVTLHYSFFARDGWDMRGLETVVMTPQKFQRLSLPVRGTPVAILYADEGFTELL
jgi:hypothetical protein